MSIGLAHCQSEFVHVGHLNRSFSLILSSVSGKWTDWRSRGALTERDLIANTKFFFVLMISGEFCQSAQVPMLFGEDFSLLGVTLGNTRGALELVWSLTLLKVLYVKLCIKLYSYMDVSKCMYINICIYIYIYTCICVNT